MFKRIVFAVILVFVLLVSSPGTALADLSFEQSFTDWTIEQRSDEWSNTTNVHTLQIVTNRYSQGTKAAKFGARVIGNSSYWADDDWTETMAWKNGSYDLRNATYLWVDMTDIQRQTSYYGWGYGMEVDLVVSDGIRESRYMLWNRHEEPYGPSGVEDNQFYQVVGGADGSQWYRYRVSLKDASLWGQTHCGSGGGGPLGNVNLASARIGISTHVVSWNSSPQDLWCSALVDNLRVDNAPPVVTFNPTSVTIIVGQGFSVSAAGTVDPDGDWIKRLAWDVNNDGTNDIIWSRTDTNGDGVVNGSDANPNYNLALTWAQMAGYAGLQSLGQHPIRLTVTDSYDASSTATILLTIRTNAPPVITFNPTSITVPLGQGFSVSATGTVDPDSDWIKRLAWDVNNDGTNDIIWNRADTNGDGVVNGSDANPNYNLALTWAQMAGYAGLQSLGQHPIRLTVSDCFDSSASANVLLTIIDNVPPVIAAPPDVTVNTDAGKSTASNVNLGQAVASDNSGSVTVINYAPAQFSLGVTDVTWKATDGSGNMASAVQKVTVLDKEAPAISITNPATGSSIVAGQSLDVQYTVTDACDANPIVVVTPSDPVIAPLVLGDLVITLIVTDASGNIGTASVTIKVVPLTESITIDVDPDTINAKSNGNWITVYIEIPGMDINQIDGSTIKLNGVVPAYLDKQGWATAASNGSNIGDYDKDGIPDRMVKFDRSAVQATLSTGDKVQITITGNIAGVPFEGIDYVKVISETKETTPKKK